MGLEEYDSQRLLKAIIPSQWLLSVSRGSEETQLGLVYTLYIYPQSWRKLYETVMNTESQFPAFMERVYYRTQNQI